MPVPYSAASDALDEYRRRREDREMREALDADAKKLSDITGEEHRVEFFTLAPCAACGGDGCHRRNIAVYESGCGFPHDDVEESPCPQCGGTGEIVVDL